MKLSPCPMAAKWRAQAESGVVDWSLGGDTRTTEVSPISLCSLNECTGILDSIRSLVKILLA